LDGVILVPLEKARSGEDPRPFSVEVVYLQRGAPWGAKGGVDLALPTIDVEVSRTGLELQYSPRFRIDNKEGSFRSASYEEPLSAAFRAPLGAEEAKAPASVGKDELQSMITNMEKGGRGKRLAGVIPLSIPFPAFGPSIFLTSELTASGTAPVVHLAYRRDSK